MLLVAAVEVVSCNILNYRHAPSYIVKADNAATLFDKDSLLGYKTRANQVMKQKRLTQTGDTIYDVKYTTDSLSRRVACYNEEENDKYALFFGGSFVFGDGLEDCQTLPNYFSRENRRYNSYNYGCSGYGPQHVYSLLKYADVEDQIMETQGVCFYIFIDDHVYRTIGDRNTLDWGASFPAYQRSGDQLVHGGSISESNNVGENVLKKLNKSYLLSILNIDLIRIFYQKQAVKNTLQYIEASKGVFEQNFCSDAFYVVIFPESRIDIQPGLKAAGIQVVDLSELQYEKLHAVDFHPTAQSNLLISQHIKGHIEK